MIDHGHGLLPIAMDCLHYQENQRPSSEELCQRLTGLKETREYRESVEQVERVQNDIAELERQMGEMQVREATTVQQLHELHDENQQQRQRYQGEIQHLKSQIQSRDVQLKQQERQILKLNQQLEEQEQVTAEIQQTNNSLQREVEQLQHQQIRQNTKPSQQPSPVPHEAHLQQDHSMKEKLSQPSPKQVHLQEPHPTSRHLTLREWRDGQRAPYNMARGAAVVDGNVAYFLNYAGQTYSYDSSTQKWSVLPQCPYWNSSLAVISGLITAIGGIKGGVTDNKLLSIVNDRDKRWEEHFPPMPTRRCYAAAVTTRQHLIVAGGKSRSNLDAVEVMDIQTLVWSTAASLPHPYTWASATICGDQLYMLGGFNKKGDNTKSVLTCSLTKLLHSSSNSSVWYRITDVPVYHSTCAVVNCELVVVGGEDAESKTTSAIHKYNPATVSWDIISNMPTARAYCLVAVLPPNEVMVLGGYTDKVEIASIL